jgi:hypothetical protein
MMDLDEQLGGDRVEAPAVGGRFTTQPANAAPLADSSPNSQLSKTARCRVQKRAEHMPGIRESKRPIGFCEREPIPASIQEKLKI